MLETPILALSILTHGPTDFEIRTVADAVHRGEILGLEGMRLVLKTAEEAALAIPCEEILSASCLRPAEAGPAPDARVELAGGETIFGSIDSGKGDLLGLRWSGEGRLEVPAGVLRRWVNLEKSGGRPADSLAPAPEGDRLYLPAAGGLDHLDGTLASFDGEGFAFESALGRSRKAFAECVALVLAPEEAKPGKEELLALVELADGSRLAGRLEGVEGGVLALASTWGPRLRVRLDRVTTIRFRNGRYVYLSELEPAEAVETPFFGGPDALRFPFRKDRSVGGGPLRCGGREYARGLGLHSRTVLRYRLEGRYASFRALAGIDDEVLGFAASGTALLRLAVDGKFVFESPPLRAGGEAVKLPEIDLRGAQEIRVEADYGDGFHVGDRVDLLEPALIRG